MRFHLPLFSLYMDRFSLSLRCSCILVSFSALSFLFWILRYHLHLPFCLPFPFCRFLCVIYLRSFHCVLVYLCLLLYTFSLRFRSFSGSAGCTHFSTNTVLVLFRFCLSFWILLPLFFGYRHTVSGFSFLRVISLRFLNFRTSPLVVLFCVLPPLPFLVSFYLLPACCLPFCCVTAVRFSAPALTCVVPFRSSRFSAQPLEFSSFSRSLDYGLHHNRFTSCLPFCLPFSFLVTFSPFVCSLCSFIHMGTVHRFLDFSFVSHVHFLLLKFSFLDATCDL